MAKVLDVMRLDGEDWVILKTTRTELKGIVDTRSLSPGSIFEVPGWGGYAPVLCARRVEDSLTDHGITGRTAQSILECAMACDDAWVEESFEPDPNAPGGG